MFINYGINPDRGQVLKTGEAVQPPLPRSQHQQVELPGGHLREEQASRPLQALLQDPQHAPGPELPHHPETTEAVLEQTPPVAGALPERVQRDAHHHLAE